MIALISIPHQTPARIVWYEEADDLICAAEYFVFESCREDADHKYDDAASAARTLADDWHGHLLVRSADDIDDVRSYTGHQQQRVAALVDDLVAEFG